MIRLETYYRSLIFNNKQVSMKEILDVFGTKSIILNNSGDGNNWRNWNVTTRVIHVAITRIDKYIE